MANLSAAPKRPSRRHAEFYSLAFPTRGGSESLSQTVGSRCDQGISLRLWRLARQTKDAAQVLRLLGPAFMRCFPIRFVNDPKSLLR